MSCSACAALSRRYTAAVAVCEQLLALPLTDRDRAYLLAQLADISWVASGLAQLTHSRCRQLSIRFRQFGLYVSYRFVRQDLHTLARRFALPVSLP